MENNGLIYRSNPYKKNDSTIVLNRSIYYGNVISIDDDVEGGRIKVRIDGLDNITSNENLPWAYPLLPKFFHVYPQVGEKVRIFLEDNKFPQRSRFWLGSVISQLQKIGFDSEYTALSTTNLAITEPQPAYTTYPDAKGVFPLKTDVAIIGKVNTDIILRVNEVHLRAGKHENDNVLKLNTKNPAQISMYFEKEPENSGKYYSNTIINSDKIALIVNGGTPTFKTIRSDANDRQKIFENGHPIARGDVLVEVLNVIRNALIGHIHGYSGVAAEKTTIINKLESINFEQILQKNIVIN